MDKIRAVIVDDEEHCLDTLTWQLKTYCPNIELLKSFQNPVECLKYLMYHQIDLLFLDIEMPLLNGFDLLNALPKKEFALIFTTAYDEFAIKAIKHRAIDYLLKPIDRSELETAVLRAEENKKNLELKLAELMKDMDMTADLKIAISTNEGVILVQPDDIVRCESDSNYAHIYLSSGKKHTVSKTLKEVEEQLDNDSFLRVHQSHLINFRYVKKYIKGTTGHLLLQDDTEIPVSRRKKTELMERIT
ncbi:MAG: response regulator transcription factor [Flavobacteriales bacterium]|nr:response regulator transcription factor [Flavobacteriales bacterium]NNK80532.1 response regulator transcription factor [Flavobacteriales bacterium]